MQKNEPKQPTGGDSHRDASKQRDSQPAQRPNMADKPGETPDRQPNAPTPQRGSPPRYDDRPEGQRSGNKDSSSDRGPTPGYGDTEPNDPRSVDVDAGDAAGKSSKSDKGSTSSGRGGSSSAS